MKLKRINREIILTRLEINMCIRMSKKDGPMLKDYWVDKLNVSTEYLDILLNEKGIKEFEDKLKEERR